MAFRITAVVNWATDQQLPQNEIDAIKARAEKAAEDFGEAFGGVPTFSGSRIGEVLGGEDRSERFIREREGNLERYS